MVQPDALVVGRVRAPQPAVDPARQVHRVPVVRPGGRRREVERRAQRRGDADGDEVALRGRLEVGALSLEVALHRGVRVLAAAQRLDPHPVPGSGRPLDLALHVEEAGEVVVDEALGHEVVVRAPRREEPRCVAAAGQASLGDQVRVREAHGRGAREGVRGGARAVLDDEQRGQPVAVLRTEGAGRQLEALDRLRVERRGQAEQAIGVVHLDPVHDRQVLIGPAAAYREPAADVLGGRDTRQRPQEPEHVVRGTRGPQHALGTDHLGRRPLGGSGGRGDLDRLAEDPIGLERDLERRFRGPPRRPAGRAAGIPAPRPRSTGPPADRSRNRPFSSVRSSTAPARTVAPATAPARGRVRHRPLDLVRRPHERARPAAGPGRRVRVFPWPHDPARTRLTPPRSERGLADSGIGQPFPGAVIDSPTDDGRRGGPPLDDDRTRRDLWCAAVPGRPARALRALAGRVPGRRALLPPRTAGLCGAPAVRGVGPPAGPRPRPGAARLLAVQPGALRRRVPPPAVARRRRRPAVVRSPPGVPGGQGTSDRRPLARPARRLARRGAGGRLCVRPDRRRRVPRRRPGVGRPGGGTPPPALRLRAGRRRVHRDRGPGERRQRRLRTAGRLAAARRGSASTG